ncbi:MAG: gamma-glutamyltransferase [Chlamydiota bacterium]|nr:gamma-glutamyltransferase [Chlamydiota bacterium]
MKGAVASGHALTTLAGIRMLEKGGNAFDALVSAAFASSVAEMGYSTLGGGGYILGHNYADGQDFLYDCFVNYPGIGADSEKFHLEPVGLNFSETTQVFNIGMGSIAVHGVLKGLIHCYVKHCTMDLKDIIAPAIEFLRDGVLITPAQKKFFDILNPIYTKYAYGRELLLGNPDRLYNPLLKEFLELCSIDDWLNILYYGDGTKQFLEDVKKGDGNLTKQDLEEYQVIERSPISLKYHDYEIITNGPPSIGGTVVSESLLEYLSTDSSKLDTLSKHMLRARILEDINKKKGAGGTTHISVIDSNNNAVGMSLSGGCCCGYFYPETGIMMNNMLGETDLHFDYDDSKKAGRRVCSMMAPTLIKKEGKVQVCLGTGGSNRIRSALLQVIWNYIDDGMDIKTAIESPRIHFDENGNLQVEPLESKDLQEFLKKEYLHTNFWSEKSLYFGGVHAVLGNFDGWGDSRRDGAFTQLYQSQ